MSIIETKRVLHPSNPDRVIIINARDFDPAIHTEVDDDGAPIGGEPDAGEGAQEPDDSEGGHDDSEPDEADEAPEEADASAESEAHEEEFVEEADLNGPYEARHSGGGWWHVYDADGNKVGNGIQDQDAVEEIAAEMNVDAGHTGTEAGD